MPVEGRNFFSKIKASQSFHYLLCSLVACIRVTRNNRHNDIFTVYILSFAMINFSFAMLNPGVYLQRRILLTKTETMYMNPDILKYSLKKITFSPTNKPCAPYCFCGLDGQQEWHFSKFFVPTCENNLSFRRNAVNEQPRRKQRDISISGRYHFYSP